MARERAEGSKTSTTIGWTPAPRSTSALIVERVVPRTWCPASSSNGTRRLPMAPAAPAKKIFMRVSPCCNAPRQGGHHQSVASAARFIGNRRQDRRDRQGCDAEAQADQADQCPSPLHPRDSRQRRTASATDKEEAGVKAVQSAAR